MDAAKTTLTDGSPVTDDHRELRPNGQQKGYVVLSQEERAKGFVRPVRDAYKHVGRPKPTNLRDLTPEEKEQYAKYNYAKYEKYPEDRSPLVGRFWTQQDLESGCGGVTTMGRALAETYAREPKFYSGTFCCHCGKHFPVGEEGEFTWVSTSERVGT